MVRWDSRRQAAIEIAALLFITFLSLAAWWSGGHGALLAALARVQPAMTHEQVVALLGHPGTINGSSDGSQSWYYTRMTWCQVKVYWNERGIVEGTDHDH